MKRTFLFTFKVTSSPDWNTYQCLIESENGKIPDLNTLIDLCERRWKKRQVELQYLCHSEFKKNEDVGNLLGKMIEYAEVWQIDENDIIRLKKRAS